MRNSTGAAIALIVLSIPFSAAAGCNRAQPKAPTAKPEEVAQEKFENLKHDVYMAFAEGLRNSRGVMTRREFIDQVLEEKDKELAEIREKIKERSVTFRENQIPLFDSNGKERGFETRTRVDQVEDMVAHAGDLEAMAIAHLWMARAYAEERGELEIDTTRGVKTEKALRVADAEVSQAEQIALFLLTREANQHLRAVVESRDISARIDALKADL